MHRTLILAEQLISRPSVTPLDGDCQKLIAERLTPLGFVCETVESGPADFRVVNLWAKRPAAGVSIASVAINNIAKNKQASQQTLGFRRPHRRRPHWPVRAMDQQPLRSQPPRRQAVRPRCQRHENVHCRLRRRG